VSVLLMSENRIGSADDGGARQQSEIPAVERVGRLLVHEENLPWGNEAAASPDGQLTPETIAFECIADGNAIDENCLATAACGLPRKSGDALQQRNALRQVAAL
jgi:hypothetical protein